MGWDVRLSPDASPYERAEDDVRLPLVRRRAAEARAPILSCNQLSGQDELVFDGDSMVVAADGSCWAGPGSVPSRAGWRQVRQPQVTVTVGVWAAVPPSLE